MNAREDVAGWMADVASRLQDEDEGQPTFEAIVRRAGDVVPDAASASVTIRSRRHRYATLAKSSPLAGEADDLQYALGEGPCMETAENDDQDFSRSGDVGSDARWPVWGPAAAQVGVASLLSVPLFAREERIGALNLYSGQPGRFATREIVDLALLYAVHAAHALTSARKVSNLEVAMSSRHSIGVAQGMVMERYGLDVHQAFNLLRRVSSETNTRLAVVATELVSSGSLPGAEDR